MASSVEEFKKKGLKDVTLPSGLSIEIQKLSRIDFMRAEVNWIQPTSDQKTPEEPKRPDGPRVASMFEYVLTHGAVSPKIFVGPENETPEGAIHESVIADDEAHLVAEILSFSGISFETQEAVEAIVKNGQPSAT